MSEGEIDEENAVDVLFEGFAKRKSGGGRSLKTCQLRIYCDGVVVDLDNEREYVLLDVSEWQIDRKKIREADIKDAGLRVDCRGDEDRVVTLWLVLPSEHERNKWKVYLIASLHPTSREGQKVRQMVAQEQRQLNIRLAEQERTRQMVSEASFKSLLNDTISSKPIVETKKKGKKKKAEIDPIHPWQEYRTETGDIYYYNSITQESRWTLEEEPDEIQEDEKLQRKKRVSMKKTENLYQPAIETTYEPSPRVETSVLESIDPALERLERSRRLAEEGDLYPGPQEVESDSSSPQAPAVETSTMNLKKKVSFKGDQVESNGGGQKAQVANALEMMLGRGPPTKLSKMDTITGDNEVKPRDDTNTEDESIDPTLSTAERLRLKRQQRQNKMFTAVEEDDTDLFLRQLAAKTKPKEQEPKPEAESTDPFQFPMDEWLDVEQEILFHQSEPLQESTIELNGIKEDEAVPPSSRVTRKKSKRVIVPEPPPSKQETEELIATKTTRCQKEGALPSPPILQNRKKGKKTKSSRKENVKQTSRTNVLESSESEESPPAPLQQKEKKKIKRKKQTKAKAVDVMESSSEELMEPQATNPSQDIEKAVEIVKKANDLLQETSSELSLETREVPKWSEHTAPDGRVYYYDAATKTSVWSKPVELQSPPPEKETPSVLLPSNPAPVPPTKALSDLVPFNPNGNALIPPHVKQDTSICPHCRAIPPTQRCVECESVFCDACCANHHLRYGSMFNHTMALLSVPYCHSCEASSASQSCVECQVNLCDACATFLHRKPPKHLHHRVPVQFNQTGREVPRTVVAPSPQPLQPMIYASQPGAIYQPLQPQTALYIQSQPPLNYAIVGPVLPSQSVQSNPPVYANEESPSVFQPAIQQVTPSPPTISMSTCNSCGGRGVDLVHVNGLCNHCHRLSQFKPAKDLGNIDWDDESDSSSDWE